jgi:hypothetical protein
MAVAARQPHYGDEQTSNFAFKRSAQDGAGELGEEALDEVEGRSAGCRLTGRRATRLNPRRCCTYRARPRDGWIAGASRCAIGARPRALSASSGMNGADRSAIIQRRRAASRPSVLKRAFCSLLSDA